MKFKILFLFLLISCAPLKQNQNTTLYESKGFAYLYNQNDFDKKFIKKRFNNENFEIGHNFLNTGSKIKVINTSNKKFIILKVKKRVQYPSFYKILITEKVADKLELDRNLPLVEIYEIRSNKSFIAEKATTHKEEQRVSNTAPVDKVKIDNISTIKKSKIFLKKKFSIIIAEFYTQESAIFLREKLKKNIPEISSKSFKIIKKNKVNYELSAGPYNTIKSLKNDYIKLNNLGFEELDVKIYE